MTNFVLPLFLCGVLTGAVSVCVRYLRRVVAGEMPQRLFPKLAKKKNLGKNMGKPLLFLLDFFFFFLFGAYLVLYDATVLFGQGRLFHFAAFGCGVLMVRYLLLTLLSCVTERVFGIVFDFLRAAVWCVFYPIRKCFSTLYRILFLVYLIIRRKNDRMKWKRKAKRALARLKLESETAFLPKEITEA